jgi:phosphate-selective porin OprO/OprP
LAVAVLIACASGAYAEDSDTLAVFWKDGLRLETADKEFQLKIGGRIQNDWVWWAGESDIQDFLAEDIDDGTEFRRARLYVAATIYDHIIMMAEYDFAGGESAFKDVYVGAKGLHPVDMVRIGHFKEPFSLEELSSDNFTTFTERALPNIFTPSRNTGIGTNSVFLDDRMTLGVGVFRDSDDVSGDSIGDNYQFSGRLTGLPLYVDDGSQLVHLGFSYRRQDPDDDEVQIQQRPEVHLSPRFVNTGVFGADSVGTYAFEGAAVFGPFSVQGEYMLADVESTSTLALPDTGDPTFSGWYVFGSWIVTGEHRTYKSEDGAFSGVIPAGNFLQGGRGALELALRYSTVDLDDEGVAGGELDDITAGINWYLNPNARIMFDYVHADLDDVDTAHAFVTRFQVNL